MRCVDKPEAPNAKRVRQSAGETACEKAKAWIAENREALEGSNEWVEKHGLPLAKYRMF